MDTIFALSSATGKAGVAVIRISGPLAHEAVRRMCGDVPPCRVAALRVLRSSKGERIDQGLVLTFAADGSFTGERSAELQVHGSPAVIAAILGCARPRLANSRGGLWKMGVLILRRSRGWPT